MDARKLTNFDEFMKEIYRTKPVDFHKIYEREGDNLRQIIKAAMTETRNPLKEFFSRQFKCANDSSELITFLGDDFFRDTLQTGTQVIDTCWHLHPKEMAPILNAIDNKLPTMIFTAEQRANLVRWQRSINVKDTTHAPISASKNVMWSVVREEAKAKTADTNESTPNPRKTS